MFGLLAMVAMTASGVSLVLFGMESEKKWLEKLKKPQKDYYEFLTSLEQGKTKEMSYEMVGDKKIVTYRTEKNKLKITYFPDRIDFRFYMDMGGEKFDFYNCTYDYQNREYDIQTGSSYHKIMQIVPDGYEKMIVKIAKICRSFTEGELIRNYVSYEHLIPKEREMEIKEETEQVFQKEHLQKTFYPAPPSVKMTSQHDTLFENFSALFKDKQPLIDEIREHQQLIAQHVHLLSFEEKHHFEQHFFNDLYELYGVYQVMSDSLRQKHKGDVETLLLNVHKKLQEYKERIENQKEQEFLKRQQILKKRWN